MATDPRIAKAEKSCRQLGLLPREALLAAGIDAADVVTWGAKYHTDADIHGTFNRLYRSVAMWLADQRSTVSGIRAEPGSAPHVALKRALHIEAHADNVAKRLGIDIVEVVGTMPEDDEQTVIDLMPEAMPGDAPSRLQGESVDEAAMAEQAGNQSAS